MTIRRKKVKESRSRWEWYVIAGLSILCAYQYNREVDVIIQETRKEIRNDIVNIPTMYKLDGTEKRFTLKGVTLTAYSNRVEETDSTPNITCTGRPVRDGMLAVSRDLWKKKIFPGDIVCVENMDRCFVADDTMNARFVNRMDVFMYDLKKAGNFKIQSDVEVIRVK